MNKLKKFLKKIPSTTVIIAVLAFAIGWQSGHYDLNLQLTNYKPSVAFINKQPPSNLSQIDFSLFWNVWNMVSTQYYDKSKVDPQKMYYGAIQGMVAAIGDPYTMFLPPDSQKATQEELGGSFEGVGMELGYNKDNRLVVIAPLQDTPAEKAGIKAGDMIVKINDKDASNTSLQDAVNQIRGPKGTDVKIEILREGETNTRVFTIKRDTIIVKSVEYSEKTTQSGKKVAYIQLSRFGGNTLDEWNVAVDKALSNQDSAVILDLRNNPGGYLDDAVSIGSEFINKGNIVQQDDGQGNVKGYPVNKSGRLLTEPLVVLINKGSASASEIVAGAIQDDKRGTLVGDQSFGKGTIQESQDLSGGTGIHITRAKWLTPNGRWIHHIGLTPDVKIALPTNTTAGQIPQDTQLDKAMEILN